MEIDIATNYYDKEKTKIDTITYHKEGDSNFWHREDGPAYQEFDENGKLYMESYYINDTWHREDGPARIWYSEDGTVKAQEFRLKGKKLTEKEWKMKQRLKGTLLEGKY